jgi:hypothetical protein
LWPATHSRQTPFAGYQGQMPRRRPDFRQDGPRDLRRTFVIGAGDYQAAPGTAAADWIVAGLQEPGQSVLSVVPAGFEAYARIFHPAGRDDEPGPVRWRDVAAANGRAAHPGMQWPSITGLHPFGEQDGQPGLWDAEPARAGSPSGTATAPWP